MSEISKKSRRELHPDFPNELILGAVGGAQDKLTLCRGDNGTYISPRRPPEEIMHRFEAADDLVDQLVSYFRRKKAEFPEWTDEMNLERIRLGLIQKVEQGKWTYTEAEQGWIMARLRERCLEPLGPGHQTEQLMPKPKSKSDCDVPYHEKPVFYASSLSITPPRTPEQIRRLIAKGRIAEMTPGQAGYDEEQ